MTKDILEKKIKELGIPPGLYSLNGMYAANGNFVMGIILDKMNERGLYRVFSMGDRGAHDHERKFSSEEDACDYMYELILRIEPLLKEEIKRKYRVIE